jgi:quinol monooxygenase YgiN
VTYVVLARWTAKDGAEDRVAAAIENLVAPSRAEPGCRVYQPHRSLEDPRIFLLYEEYEDEVAYEAHGASDHFRQHALGEGIPLLESRERTFFEPFGPPG